MVFQLSRIPRRGIDMTRVLKALRRLNDEFKESMAEAQLLGVVIAHVHVHRTSGSPKPETGRHQC